MVKISAELLRGVIDLIVGGVGGLIVYRFKRSREKRKESILLSLALMRRDAVALRNEGEKKELEEIDLNLWIKKVQQFQEKIIAKAKKLSPIDGTRLATLDRVQVLAYPHIHNQTQVKTLQNFSERIQRLDKLLEKYQPTDN